MKIYYAQKILALWMIVTVMITMAGGAVSPTVADAADDLPIVIEEDFDSMTMETARAEWASGNYVSVKSHSNPKANGANENLCLRSDAVSPTQTTGMSFSGIGGIVKISYDLWIELQPTGQIKLPEIKGMTTTGNKLLTIMNAQPGSDAWQCVLDIPHGSGRYRGTLELQKWNSFEFVFDTENNTFSVKLNNRQILKDALYYNKVNAINISSIFFYPMTETNSAFAIDNVRVLGKEVADAEFGVPKLEYARDIDVVSDSYYLTENLTGHPRLAVNDFNVLKEKIQKNKRLTQWYQVVRDRADVLTNTAPQELPAGFTNTSILTIARGLEDRVMILSMAYQLERDPKYLNALYRNLEAAANFSTWQPSSFLSVAEFATAFAIAYDWNYNDWTEEQRKVIRDGLFSRALYYGMDFYDGITYGSTNFYVANHNWNIVCNTGLMLAALAVGDEFPNTAEYILSKSSESMWKAVDEYAPFGAWAEGIMYWDYATRFLTMAMAGFSTAFQTGTVLPAQYRWDRAEGISETAEFYMYMMGQTGMFNYGDARSSLNTPPAIEWMAARYNKPEYMRFFLDVGCDTALNETARSIVKRVIWFEPELEKAQEEMPLDKAYFGEGTVNNIFMRDSWDNDNGLYLGVKGGNNYANHGTISMGTFVLDAAGVRWGKSHGQGDYNWTGWFDMTGGRFQYYANRPEGSNTLVLNPDSSYGQRLQATGYVERAEFGARAGYGIMDMTEAYQDYAQHVRRGVRIFDSRGKFLIQDEVTAESAVETWWFMHTDVEGVSVAEDGKSAILYQDGARLYAEILDGPQDAEFYLMDAKPLPTSPNPSTQWVSDYGEKLAVHTAGNAGTMRLAILLTPLSSGENPPDSSGITISPLDEWSLTEEEKSESLRTLLHNSIVLLKDSPQELVYGDKKLFDEENSSVTLTEREGTLYVPLRAVAEQLRNTVSYDEPTATSQLKNSYQIIQFQENSSYLTENGTRRRMSAAAYEENGRLMVPLKDLTEVLDYTTEILENGLVILSRNGTVSQLDEQSLVQLYDVLNWQLWVNGTLFPSFRGDWNTYSLIAPDGTQGPEVSLKTTDGEIVAQTTVNNGIAQLKTERGDYFLQFGAAALPDETERQVKELKILAYESVNSVTLPDSLKIPEDSGLAATVTASSETELSHAVDVLDDDLDTKWAASGEHWILFDFGETKNLTSLSLATYLGNQRQYQFDVQVSDDGENFRTVLQGAQTSGTTLMPEVFELSNAQGRYARIDGHGYVGGGTYNSYSRVRFFDDPEEQKAEQFVWKVESQTVFRQGTKAYITVGAYDYNQQKIEDRPIKLTYTSSAPDIASVNENGVIQFLKAGTVTITVMAECDHVIRLQSIELTVEPGEP